VSLTVLYPVSKHLSAWIITGQLEKTNLKYQCKVGKNDSELAVE